MYTFAIAALLALATVKLVDFLADNIGAISRHRSLLTFVVAVAAVMALDWSLFDGFGTDIRDRDLGLWATGFAVAGLTVPWRAVFGWLTHDRAMGDETLSGPTAMRKVA